MIYPHLEKKTQNLHDTSIFAPLSVARWAMVSELEPAKTRGGILTNNNDIDIGIYRYRHI
jgi:hypothetical protein